MSIGSKQSCSPRSPKFYVDYHGENKKKIESPRTNNRFGMKHPNEMHVK